jgi:hypothetical protein
MGIGLLKQIRFIGSSPIRCYPKYYKRAYDNRDKIRR